MKKKYSEMTDKEKREFASNIKRYQKRLPLKVDAVDMEKKETDDRRAHINSMLIARRKRAADREKLKNKKNKE